MRQREGCSLDWTEMPPHQTCVCIDTRTDAHVATRRAWRRAPSEKPSAEAGTPVPARWPCRRRWPIFRYDWLVRQLEGAGLDWTALDRLLVDASGHLGEWRERRLEQVKAMKAVHIVVAIYIVMAHIVMARAAARAGQGDEGGGGEAVLATHVRQVRGMACIASHGLYN